MKIMAGEVLEIVNRVQKILQYYRKSTVINMLDEIYLRCCTADELTHGYQCEAVTASKGISPKKPAAPKTANGKLPLENEEDFLALQEKLRGLELEKAEVLLDSYTTKQLCAFADYMSISILKSGRKGVIVGQISNHFGFRILNSKMEQRPNMQRE